MVRTQNPAQSIPKGLNRTTLFRGYTLNELFIIAAPALLIWYGGQFLPSPISDYRLFLGLVGILVGAAINWRTPNHLEPTEWVIGYIMFMLNPDEINHVKLEGGMARKQKDVVNSDILTLAKRTQDEHGIKRIHMNKNALEREDGQMIGAVEATSVLNMALANEEKWEVAVDAWETYLNSTINYPIQVYVRSVPFNVNEYINDYRSRLEDEDIRTRPIMEEILRSFLTWYPDYLSNYGTNEREFYIIFKTKASNINRMDYQEDTIGDLLFKIPLLGKYVGNDPEEIDLTETEKKQLMFNELDKRCQTAMRQGLGQLDQTEMRRVTGTELAFLNKEFWQGRNMDGMSNENLAPPEKGAMTASGNQIDSAEVLEQEVEI